MDRADRAKSFTRAKDTYRENAVVQNKMAKKLICELKALEGNDFKTVFEAGSGTGLLTEEAVKGLNFETFVLNDITENFTGFEEKGAFKYIKADILNLEEEEFFKKAGTKGADLIISNAVFQWIEDKEKLFLKLNKMLKSGSILAFTTFGKNNFIQFKDLTGPGLNYENLEPVIKKTGFKILYFEEELETLYFSTVNKILEHIKLTGVGIGAGCFWGKDKYEAFKRAYLEKFSDSNGVELTYHPEYFICKKAS